MRRCSTITNYERNANQNKEILLHTFYSGSPQKNPHKYQMLLECGEKETHRYPAGGNVKVKPLWKKVQGFLNKLMPFPIRLTASLCL